MAVFYLDTSALLKKYRTEKGTEVVGELFQEKRPSETFVVSYFGVLEAISTATRLFTGGTLTRRLYSVLLGNLDRDLREGILIQSVSDAVVREAIQVAMSYGLRAPDAIHLSTAIRARLSTSEPVYFLCSDARLKAASEESRLAVIDPEAADALETLRRYRAIG